MRSAPSTHGRIDVAAIASYRSGMRDRAVWRELLIGGDDLDPDGFVERMRVWLRELGYTEGHPNGTVRPLCHLGDGGPGAWIAGLFPAAPARTLARRLAAETHRTVTVLEAVVRPDGSERAAIHQVIEVLAEHTLADGERLAIALPPLAEPAREAPEGADPKVAAEHFARLALEEAWPHVRKGRTRSRIPLGRWLPPARDFVPVEGVTDPAEARFVARLRDATEKSIVAGPGGKPALRLVLADGSRQLTVLGPRELAWAKRVLT